MAASGRLAAPGNVSPIRDADQRKRGIDYVLERQQKGLLVPKVDRIFDFEDGVDA